MMTTAKNVQPATKQIENLSLKELDMIYSLVRVGDWSDSEIARRHRISETDVHKAFENYPQLREAVSRNPRRDVLPQAPESELTTKKPRKRRSDAVYATAKEGQAAYRSRLKQSRGAAIEQPSPAADTDIEGPTNGELTMTVCQYPAIEPNPQNTYPQQTTCDSSREDVPPQLEMEKAFVR
jgi:hypothetical protein